MGGVEFRYSDGVGYTDVAAAVEIRKYAIANTSSSLISVITSSQHLQNGNTALYRAMMNIVFLILLSRHGKFELDLSVKRIQITIVDIL